MSKKITFWPALLTAVGMVIGSGIFFKADDILKLSGGNVTSAILGWAAFGGTLIFAGICLSIVAANTKSEGGCMGYVKDMFGDKAGFAVGWFETVIYVPVFASILATVASKFLFQLLGFDTAQVSVLAMNAVGFIIIVALFVINALSTRFAALFSSLATVVKMLPIVIIGCVGLTQINPGMLGDGARAMDMGTFTAPILSMSFAFAGWNVVPSLARDMENPKKDLTLILGINAIIITAAYIFYFSGVTMLMPADEIIKLGDAHAGVIAGQLFGDIGEKLILFCVVISCLGTLNGKVMAAYSYPFSLAKNGDIPEPFATTMQEKTKTGTSVKASILPAAFMLVWFILYTVQAYSKAAAGPEATSYMFSGITFDDIPVVIMSIEAIVLIVGSIMISRKLNSGILKTWLMPAIALVGQVYCIISYISTNSQWLLYSIISGAIILAGLGVKKMADDQKAKPIKAGA